ncbi:MAG: outer membrane protein assembly factor BamA [candidate division WOR-3 bacterium]
MSLILLALLSAAPPVPDTARLVITDVSARTVSADPLVVVRTAGLNTQEIYTPGALRTALEDAIRRIYGMGIFSQVVAETSRLADGVSVTFVTREYPRLRLVQFEGFRRVRKKDLEAKVKAREGEVLTDKKVFDWQQEILKLYKDRGFLLAKVYPEQSPPDSLGRVILTYKIEEGDPVRIRHIEFYGNDHFTDRQLENRMTNRHRTWFRKGQLKEDQFIKDLDRIVDFYKQRGFIDAKVIDYDMKFDKGSVDIIIGISEGRRYYFGQVTFKGDSVMTRDQLQKLVRYKTGRHYNTRLTQATLTDIYGLYSEEGYIYAQITPVENLRHDTVDITYQIVEGIPATVRLVNIEGNLQTHDKVIRREISSLPGYLFKRSEVLRSQRDIFNLGFFDDVTVDYRPADTFGQIDLTYKVKEKSFFGTIGAGVSYSAQDRFTGYIELQQPNLFGRSQKGSLKLEYGKNKQNVELGFTEPWLFDTPTSAGFDVSYLTRTYDYYDKQELGGGLSFSRPLALDYTRAYFTLRVSDAYIPPSSIKPGYTPSKIYSVYSDTVHKTAFGPGVTLTRDSRDYIYNPLSGSALTYTFALSFWDIRFHRHILDASQHFPLFWKFGLMARTRLGIITGYTSRDTVPLYERFYAGGTGPDGIRGYGDRTVGPRAAGYPIGGLALSIFSLEYRFRPTPQLALIAFADAGNAWNSIDQFSLSDLKRGAGVGIRLEIPMLGLIGFDFGYGFDKDRPGWEPHFQLGRTF